GRSSPQAAIVQFLEACHARDYTKAAHYLNLRNMSAADRGKNGPHLAEQLEDLLDDTGFDIATLSRDLDGDQSDGLDPTLDRLATFKVNGQTVQLEMERVELKSGVHVWLVSQQSVALIPTAHTVIGENGFEKLLPQQLVTFEILDTALWRWIALIVLTALSWILATLIAWLFVKVLPSVTNLGVFQGPIRWFLFASGFRIALAVASPSSLIRLFLERTAGLAITLAFAWAIAEAADLLAKRWHTHLDPRVQAVSYSVLPLGLQILKLTIFLIALLSVIHAWGFSISTVLAGIGVGGIAIALAAQKTIENLFGGVSVIGDRPVLVGDFCRWNNQVGTVIDIGLRSTRIRTLDRTVISIPNGQFSSMQLENFSPRDKVWFHPTLNLRKDTTSAQLQKILADCVDILKAEPKAEVGSIPVRFIGPGPYSLDVEIFAYITTPDFDEFLGIQQKLLLKIVEAVEAAG